MHKEYEPHSFIKEAPLETEDIYLIYKRAFFEDITIDDMADTFATIEYVKIDEKYAKHMLNAIKNEELLNSLDKNTKSYLKNIFSKAVNLAVITSSQIDIYLSKAGKYAVVDISNHILDIFYPELILFEELTVNASEIMISNNSEREDFSTISFYFDFEEDSLNIVNSVKNKLKNI